MSLFGTILIRINETDKSLKIEYLNTDKCLKKSDKCLIDRIEDNVNKVFSNMKKRGSYTNLRIDYPWLTI